MKNIEIDTDELRRLVDGKHLDFYCGQCGECNDLVQFVVDIAKRLDIKPSPDNKFARPFDER